MTSFGWWGHQALPGTALCCLCFSTKPLEQFIVDESGQRWDVCSDCRAEELVLLARRALGDDVPPG